MARCLQKFLPQAYTSVSTCQEKKGSVRTKRIEALYTKSGGDSLREGEKGRAVSYSCRGCPHVPNACEIVCGGIGILGTTRVKIERDFRENETALGRRGDHKSRRAEDGEMRRGGERDNFFFSVLPSPFFLLTNSRARHPAVEWRFRV